MTADLVAFLRERLDEDERAALDATQHRWIVSERRTPASPNSPYGDLFLVAADEGFGAPAFRFKDERDARHIARHDPARVLAEVDAKRRILAEYSATVLLRDEADARVKAAWPEPDAQDLDTWTRAQREAAIMHDWVLQLALPFRDHTEYRAEWAPDD